MTKALLIDLTKCIGCYNCATSCKDEHVDNDWSPYAKPQPETGHMWVKVQYRERGRYPKVKVANVPTPCMHCDNAPCIKAATGGAIYKRPDGIVIIDPVKSVGQKQVVASCPYGAIYWNDQLNIPQKCTLCAHLLDRGWTETRCSRACPTNALIYGEYEDLKKTIDGANAATLLPENQPRVYYVGLPKTFITGALVDSNGECVAGANVKATDTSTNQVAASTSSDSFGDFWLDGLTASKTYQVAINAAGKTKTVSVSLDTDKNLGDIQL